MPFGNVAERCLEAGESRRRFRRSVSLLTPPRRSLCFLPLCFDSRYIAMFTVNLAASAALVLFTPALQVRSFVFSSSSSRNSDAELNPSISFADTFMVSFAFALDCCRKIIAPLVPSKGLLSDSLPLLLLPFFPLLSDFRRACWSRRRCQWHDSWFERYH